MIELHCHACDVRQPSGWQKVKACRLGGDDSEFLNLLGCACLTLSQKLGKERGRLVIA